MILVGRGADEPAVDAVQTARDPSHQHTKGEKETSTQVGSLDGVLNDKLVDRLVGRRRDAAERGPMGVVVAGWGRYGGEVLARSCLDRRGELIEGDVRC